MTSCNLQIIDNSKKIFISRSFPTDFQNTLYNVHCLYTLYLDEKEFSVIIYNIPQIFMEFWAAVIKVTNSSKFLFFVRVFMDFFQNKNAAFCIFLLRNLQRVTPSLSNFYWTVRKQQQSCVLRNTAMVKHNTRLTAVRITAFIGADVRKEALREFKVASICLP